MNHKVESVQGLHDSASNLYSKYVVGSDAASADTILHNLLILIYLILIYLIHHLIFILFLFFHSISTS